MIIISGEVVDNDNSVIDIDSSEISNLEASYGHITTDGEINISLTFSGYTDVGGRTVDVKVDEYELLDEMSLSQIVEFVADRADLDDVIDEFSLLEVEGWVEDWIENNPPRRSEELQIEEHVEAYEETPIKEPLTISQITKLKEAGFDAEEIAKLHSKGVV